MADSALPRALSTAGPESLPPAERTPRVLVVSEAPSGALFEQVRGALARDQLVVVACRDLERLDDVLLSEVPDVVLIDLSLPNAACYEICSELRRESATGHVPLFLVSTSPIAPDEIARGLFCGADDCIALTDRAVEFQARVRVQLRNKRERDRLVRLKGERDAYRAEATVDALTGLPNRRFLDTKLKERTERGTGFTLLFVDIDHFKQINDTLGHDAGDVVLRRVADALSTAAHGNERCGRFGGEEFLVIHDGFKEGDAFTIGERFRTAVEGLPPLDGGRRVTVSVGCAVQPPGLISTVDAVCKRADRALYEAKGTGRNRVVVAPPPRVAGPSIRLVRTVPRESPLEEQLVKELRTGRAGLPMLPEAAREALRLADDPRTDMLSIARLVDRDPPLAARFLAVSSSALYALSAKVTSTQGALVRLGLSASRDVLLQVVYERTNTDLPLYREEVVASFEHSVRTAQAARRLSQLVGRSYEHAYLAGLLHDIGEARIYRIVGRMKGEQPHPDELRRLVGSYHPEAGGEVGRAWRLPEPIVEACVSHHDAFEGAPPHAQLVMASEAILRLVDDQVDSPDRAARERAGKTKEDDLALLTAFGLPERKIELLVAETSTREREAAV